MKGFGPISYLIARGRLESLHDWNKPYITYTPPGAVDDLPWIGSYDGHTPHDPGGESSPQQFLERPGLVRMLAQLDGAWFQPFLQRLAAAERVPIGEIAAVYQDLHGRPLESKAFGTRLFPCEQWGYDWAKANPLLKTCLINLIGCAAGIADSDWNAWQRSTAREFHGYIEAQYFQGKPCPPIYIANLPLRELAGWCIQAARAAEREGVATPAGRRAALEAPGVFGRGHASYQTLFKGLI